MNINEKYYINKKRNENNVYYTNLLNELSNYKGITKFEYDSNNVRARAAYSYIRLIYDTVISNNSNEAKDNALIRLYKMIGLNDTEISSRLFITNNTTNTTNSIKNETSISKKQIVDACQHLIDFFKQFDFKPSFRFINTLAISENPMEYTINYFKIFDSQYALDIAEKIKSAEYSNIIKTIRTCTPKNIVNKHLEIFFGDPGGGKTTLGYSLCKKRVVCSSEMLPDALMQVFDFDAGKATFNKSELWLAMEDGDSILLDEFNTLPYESIKFLQGITDNKEEINYKGHIIKIHPNFKIIGTMNLNTENGVMPVSHALADRAAVIREFVVTAEQLADSLI